MRRSNTHRIYLGIITGVFMFGAYFLLDMMFALNTELYNGLFLGNRMYFIMFTFVVGIIFAQVYIWYYNKGLRKVGMNVKSSAT